MRRLIILGLVCGACNGDGPREPRPDTPEPETPIASVDAGSIDAATPDEPVPATIFETATIRSGPHEVSPGLPCDDWQPRVGARFTTARPYTITALGAHIRMIREADAGRTLFMAIVPLDPMTNLPQTLDLSDAVGAGFAAVPYWQPTTLDAAPPSTTFPVNFELPAGTWGVVVGSNGLDVPSADAALPFDVEPVGDPRYFIYNIDSFRWAHTQNDSGDVRLFVTGY